MCAAQSVCLLNYNEDQANKLTTSGLFRHTALVVWSDGIHWGKKACRVSGGRRDTVTAICSVCCCCPMVLITGLSLETWHHRWPSTPKITLTETAHVLQSHRHAMLQTQTSTLSHKEPHGQKMIVLISNTGDGFSVASWLALRTH